MAETASTAERRLTRPQSSTKATTSSTHGEDERGGGRTAPVTSGRFRVRCMTLSMSRSTYMLMALAPPAARVPPTRVATIRLSRGSPRWATIIVGSVVTSSSSMMRGLVSAT